MNYSTKTQQLKKVIALTLICGILHSTFLSKVACAQTGAKGAKQSESETFIPANVSNLVQLQTGDFLYNIPLINIPGPGGGYPLSMFYTADAAIKPESDASWVGLGWNLNPGSIHRIAKGIPDDWNDKISDVLNYSEQFISTVGGGVKLIESDKEWLATMYNKHNYGSLYITGANKVDNSDMYHQNKQIKNYSADVYTNPYGPNAYKDIKQVGQSNALSFPNYDSYSVSGQGISGSISPKIYEFGQLLQGLDVLSIYNDGQKHEELTYYNHPSYRFSKSRDKIHFQFDYNASGFSKVKSSMITLPNQRNNYSYPSGGYEYQNPDNLSFYNSTNKRSGQGRYIEYFTNDEINNNYSGVVSRGFIETQSQKDKRNGGDLYDPTGIGAFSITTEDGTTYHYSIPVYQFEEFFYFQDTRSPNSDYQEKSNRNMYAYDWLLTSITGPDYVDNGTIEDGTKGMIDETDEGYFVQFDYGKWTDGYLWRTPHQSNQYTPGPVGTNYQSYSFGRKQIYYLNSIKTKTHTAYFIKSLRLDGRGKQVASSLTYNKKKDDYLGSSPISCLAGNSPGLYTFITSEQEVIDAGEGNYQLKLDKIILLNNADAKFYENILSGNNNIGNKTFKLQQGGTTKLIGNLNRLLGRSYGNENVDYNPNCSLQNLWKTFQSYYEGNILDYKDVQDIILSIESKALKVIEFNSGIQESNKYLLCGNTPNSDLSVEGNKLTLLSVKIYGLEKEEVFPPYLFSYKGQKNTSWPEIKYNTNNIDNWGYYSETKHDLFNKINSDAWCLNEITTPMGGKIKVVYESDTYAKEAVFGSLPKPYIESNTNSVAAANKLICSLAINVRSYRDQGFLKVGDIYRIKFTKYIPKTYQTYPCGRGTCSREIPASTTINYRDLSISSIDVNSNSLIFNYPISFYSSDFGVNSTTMISIDLVTPQLLYGGGIRVKEVILNDGAGNNYKTSYSYVNPFTNNSSGITSYALTNEDKYIPYVNELPAPGVMYEYTTVEEKGTIDQSYLKTRYKFDVLQSAIGGNSTAFFSMGDKISVRDSFSPYSYDNTTDNQRHWYHVYCRTAKIDDNKAAIGRLLEVAILNKNNQVQSRDTYKYFQPNSTDIYKNGISEETFGEIKEYTIWDPMVRHSAWYCFWNGCYTDQTSSRLWYLTSSTRKTYPSLLKSVTHESNGLVKTDYVTKYDFYTGLPVETEVVNNDGAKYRTNLFLAYSKYSSMGSKIYNVNNKNMVVQEAQRDNFCIDANLVAKRLSSNIQTWNNGSMYRYYNPTGVYLDLTVNNGIFRKGKSYVWKSALDNDGTINTFSPFNFALSDGGNSNWQKTNEITRYDFNSLPLESKDINGNYSSNKMGRDSRFAIASSGTSTYRSFTHSGFEDMLNDKYFEGEVALNDATQVGALQLPPLLSGGPVINIKPHTGTYMLKVPPSLGFNPLFIYKPDEDIQKGKTYRASVWVYKNSPPETVLYAVLDGNTNGNNAYIASFMSITQSTVEVGDWKLLTVNIDIPVNYSPSGGSLNYNDLRIFVFNLNGLSKDAYIDDLRLQPVNSPTTGYVYDNNTGFLKAILDNENFATLFSYDAAGRLIRTDKETLTGIKKVSETVYHN